VSFWICTTSQNLLFRRYAKGKLARHLQDCISQIESLESQIEQTLTGIEELRAGVQELDKELNESGSTNANIRENLRIRKIRSDLGDIKTSMDALNLEAAGQARQDYERTYKEAKEREVQVQSKVRFFSPS
jgi:DNA repair protein RAD50